jgi:hypothetical protein
MSKAKIGYCSCRDSDVKSPATKKLGFSFFVRHFPGNEPISPGTRGLQNFKYGREIELQHILTESDYYGPPLLSFRRLEGLDCSMFCYFCFLEGLLLDY